MAKKAFDGIMAGMLDVLAHIEGNETAARIITVNPATVKTARKKTGLTREAFAKMFGLSVASLRKWENGERVPSGAARILLTIISREPEAAMRALRS